MRPIKQFHLSIITILDGMLIHVNFKVIMQIMDPIVKPKRKLIVLLKSALMSIATPNKKTLVQKVEKISIELLLRPNLGTTNTKQLMKFQTLFYLKATISEIWMVSISLTH